MNARAQLRFGPFRLDPADGRLWRGKRAIALAPKAFAVLHDLVEHHGVLRTKAELLDTVWPETHVSDSVLKVVVAEVREALGDPARRPRFIETAHRRGYRFIAEVDGGDPGEAVGRAPIEPEETDDVAKLPHLVGRAAELEELERSLAESLGGNRRVVFVSGEAGIGKTSLVDAFLERAASAGRATIARGQCLELYGPGEAYRPVLEMLSHLCRGPGGETLVPLLRSHAPTWLLQMPWLVRAEDRRELERETFGGSRERMLREMSEAIESFTATRPLVFALEDLHWSDASTLDLVAHLAARREPARFLLICTYRPVEIILSGHPLKSVKQDLEAHGRAREITLGYLSERDIAEYLAVRFAVSDFPDELAGTLHRHTDGHPLFLVGAVDDLVARGWLGESGGVWRLGETVARVSRAIPENVRRLIEHELDRLDLDDRRLIEAAALAGLEFSAPIVAPCFGGDVARLEERCEALAEQGAFMQRSTAPVLERSAATPYRFRHTLFREVAAQRIGSGRAASLHRAIGEAKEAVYGESATAVAAELAAHFEEAGDSGRAIHHLRRVAESSAQRYAHREAAEHLTRALELAADLPPTEAERLRLALLEERGIVRRSAGELLAAAEDFEAIATLARNRRLVDGEARGLLQLGSVLLWVDRQRCLSIIDRVRELAPGIADDRLRAHARGLCASWNLELRGWREEDARASMDAVETARRADDRAALGVHVARHAYFRLHRSEYVETCRVAEEGLELAIEAGDAYSHFVCQVFRGWALVYLGRWDEAWRGLNEAIAMAERNGNHLGARILRLALAILHEQAFDFESARVLAERGRKESEEAWHTYGQLLSLILLGRAYLGLGRLKEAFECLDYVREWRENVLLDWILQMPLQYSLSECFLARGDAAAARRHAERLRELAAQSGERTYLGFASRCLAEALIAQGRLKDAAREISRSLPIVERGDTPLAEWRLCATAAVVQDRLGRKTEARRFRARVSSIVRRLGDSLVEAPVLQRAFSTHPVVREVVGTAKSRPLRSNPMPARR